MIPDEVVEVAARAAAKDEDASNWDDEPDYYRTGWMNRILPALEAAAPHLMAAALDVAADQLDTLWNLRKERMYEQRDWADGVEESETLIKKMAAGLRSAGAGE